MNRKVNPKMKLNGKREQRRWHAAIAGRVQLPYAYFDLILRPHISMCMYEYHTHAHRASYVCAHR